MKKIFLVFSIIILSVPVFSQDNSVEFGFFGLINRNIYVSYERKLTDYASAGIGFGYIIPGKLPHVNAAIGILSNVETEGYFEDALKNLKFSAFSITPELHYYFGKSGCKGLYIGPYARYADYFYHSQYTADVDYTNSSGLSLTKNEVVFTLTGNYQTFGAGIVFGYKWLIQDKFIIDWCIAGPGLLYATAKANVVAPDFPPEEPIKDFVENELNVIPDLLGKIDVTEVSKIEAQGTWKKIYPNCRFNISVGYLF